MIKIQAVSDLHGNLPEGIDCDLLLIGGDICPSINHQLWYQKMWFENDFVNWLFRQKYKKAILVAGNHDFILEERSPFYINKILNKVNCTYLQDSFYDYDFERFCGSCSYRIYGSPWQPRFRNWAFNLDEEDLAKKWLKIPEKTDILLLHGPPRGYGCMGLSGAGSPSLTERIKQIQPILVICGHIHEGYGEYKIGESLVVNVSSVDDTYKLRKNPIWNYSL